MTADTLTPLQCRMARAGLHWSIERLAHESGVSKGTIANFEQGHSKLIQSTRAALRQSLENAGMGFLPATAERGVGVYLREP